MYRIMGSLVAALLLFSGSAHADKYGDTVQLFKNAGASNAFFGDSHGYAVFPTIGKGGFGKTVRRRTRLPGWHDTSRAPCRARVS